MISPEGTPDLTPEVELDPEVDLWRKGRELRNIVNTPGWDIVCATLKQYADSADLDLRRLKPGQNESVVAQHAVVYALQDLVEKFIADIQTAVDASHRVPESIKAALAALGQQ